MTYEEACDRGYDGPPRGRRRRMYNCGGPGSYHGPCGAPDCSSCRNGTMDDEPDEEEVASSRVVVARKARRCWWGEIRPGDTVRVTTGFTYIPGGKRTGYFKRFYRVAKGPAWEASHG